MPLCYIDLSTIRKHEKPAPDAPEGSVALSDDGIPFLPKEPYIFSYGPLRLVCKHCKGVFDASEVGKPKDSEFGDEVGWNVCPKCDKPDFLDEPLYYEDIDQALARMKPKDRKRLEALPGDPLEEFDALRLHMEIFRRRIEALLNEKGALQDERVRILNENKRLTGMIHTLSQRNIEAAVGFAGVAPLPGVVRGKRVKKAKNKKG